MQESSSFKHFVVDGRTYYYINELDLVSSLNNMFGIDISVEEILGKVMIKDSSIDFNLKVAKGLLDFRRGVNAEGRYTATLRTNPSGNSYSVQFRHPLLLDEAAKPGRKVRKGLGLKIDVAELVVNELNSILLNRRYWSAEGKKLAKQLFTDKTTQIFYDNVEF